MTSPTSITAKHFTFLPSSSSSFPPKSRVVTLSYLPHEQIECTPQSLLENLTLAERQKVQKYRMASDQKLSYGSILLQHHAICHQFGCDKSQYEIHRTSAGKPYVLSKAFEIESWNYNVSHHGSYVGIVESTGGNIGLDIATLTPRKSWDKGATEYLNMFHNQFTCKERKWQSNGHNDQERYRRFFVNWSLKEAYIKAIGRGLQMDLLDLEFHIEINDYAEEECVSGSKFDGKATLTVLTDHHRHQCQQGMQHQEGVEVGGDKDTAATAGWLFTFCSLDEDHVAAIAIAPSSPSCLLSSPPSIACTGLDSPSFCASHVSLNPVRVTVESLLAPPVYF